MTHHSTIINGNAEAIDVFEFPPDLDEKRVRMYETLVKEFRSLYTVALAADLEMIATACRAAQREEEYAEEANRHFTERNLMHFDLFLRHSRAEAALKRQSLLALSLIGNQATQRADGPRKNAANSGGSIGAVTNNGGDRWANLLPSQ